MRMVCPGPSLFTMLIIGVVVSNRLFRGVVEMNPSGQTAHGLMSDASNHDPREFSN